MSFKSVWGFDPDEVIRAQKLGRREPNVDESVYDSEEQRPPGMPLDVYGQMYELRRMFGLRISRIPELADANCEGSDRWTK
jgi:hypothetical protein